MTVQVTPTSWGIPSRHHGNLIRITIKSFPRDTAKTRTVLPPSLNPLRKCVYIYISQRLLGTSLRGFWPSPRGFWPWTLMTRVWDPQEIHPTIPQGPGGSNNVQGSVSYPSCGPIHGLVFKCFALVTLDIAAPFKVAEDISIDASH